MSVDIEKIRTDNQTAYKAYEQETFVPGKSPQELASQNVDTLLGCIDRVLDVLQTSDDPVPLRKIYQALDLRYKS